MKFSFPAIYTKCEEGGFCVDIIDIPCAVTDGQTFRSAEFFACDLLRLLLLDNTYNCQHITPTKKEDIVFDKTRQLVRMVEVEIDDKYLKPSKEQIIYSFPLVYFRDRFNQKLIYAFFPDIDNSIFSMQEKFEVVCDHAFDILYEKYNSGELKKLTPSRLEELKLRYPKFKITFLSIFE